ncbi:unnamed protein product [Linum tenue]|uniref:Uncharacterized protein n=1 Tax=Linum tenue TaxID=586396 RepID=A0AAV0L707_9ROSI|nr:unnamed protein product [Linum tenue]
MERARRYRRDGDLGSVRRLQIQLRHRRGVDRHGGRHFPLPLRPPRQGRAGSDGQAIREGEESGGGGPIGWIGDRASGRVPGPDEHEWRLESVDASRR